jgi:hypothetical protein
LLSVAALWVAVALPSAAAETLCMELRDVPKVLGAQVDTHVVFSLTAFCRGDRIAVVYPQGATADPIELIDTAGNGRRVVIDRDPTVFVASTTRVDPHRNQVEDQRFSTPREQPDSAILALGRAVAALGNESVAAGYLTSQYAVVVGDLGAASASTTTDQTMRVRYVGGNAKQLAAATADLMSAGLITSDEVLALVRREDEPGKPLFVVTTEIPPRLHTLRMGQRPVSRVLPDIAALSRLVVAAEQVESTGARTLVDAHAAELLYASCVVNGTHLRKRLATMGLPQGGDVFMHCTRATP